MRRLPYAYEEAGWFVGALALIGAGLGIVWRMARP